MPPASSALQHWSSKRKRRCFHMPAFNNVSDMFCCATYFWAIAPSNFEWAVCCKTSDTRYLFPMFLVLNCLLSIFTHIQLNLLIDRLSLWYFALPTFLQKLPPWMLRFLSTLTVHWSVALIARPGFRASHGGGWQTRCQCTHRQRVFSQSKAYSAM